MWRLRRTAMRAVSALARGRDALLRPSVINNPIYMHGDKLAAHADDKVRTRTDDTLHRSKGNILRRNKADNSCCSRHNMRRRRTDIRSKHACKLDDKPGERADDRVHSSTVHDFVGELVWSQSSHSAVLRSWMGSLSRRRQRWRELTSWTFSSHLPLRRFGLVARQYMTGPGGHPHDPHGFAFIATEQLDLLWRRGRATCAPYLTPRRTTLPAGCASPHTSFHTAGAPLLTTLRSGFWASRGGLGWRGGRRSSLGLGI